jgi:nitroimidazol reductase NimA-like FMN-containing flavoprotein (pyridoxamine 5'-phosphate oxidase superfamily)
MSRKPKDLILQILDGHRVMALGTNRPDGWPQVTQVGYVNDGFLLYCFVAPNSQKLANILRDPRVSIAIGSDASDPLEIKGLSLAARALAVTDQSELDRVIQLRLKRYLEHAGTPAPMRPLSPDVVLLRIEPEIFSVLDYSKGFGHSDLVTFSEHDLDVHIESLHHYWERTAQGSDVNRG